MQSDQQQITLDANSKEKRAERLLYLRKYLLNLTREKFASESSGFVPYTLKGWESAWGNGLTEKGALLIVKRAKELDIYCTCEWLMHGVGRPATRYTEDLTRLETAEKQIAKELLLFREQPYAIDALVTDDAMIPMLYPNTYVGGIITKNIENALDKECIIIDNKDNTYIRLLKKGSKKGYYHLLGLNDRSNQMIQIHDIKIKIAAPIVWIRRPNFQE